MSSKLCGTILLFVEKVNGEILQKQNEIRQIISGPLALAREKLELLESDEAQAVLARIDVEYSGLLKRSVSGIYYEELGRANLILEEIDLTLKELQDLLNTTLQRISNEKLKGDQDVSFLCGIYEDARAVLVFLKLKTNLIRSCLEVALDEAEVKINLGSELEIEEGDFLLHLSKLETSCLLLPQ